ncbi:hypothetical protein KGF57_000459 [Candida theae]|uniref:Protein SCD5 n=1 Tax=Candida theae TaxID=1198502 RepID=A0AAD5BIZ3_9ASCO|nr:uncharacterized protein KGF57_000459 [Candida theae]KAI5967244.1 hypothetical protein KGF57_000459 [Candida theae]
MNWYDVDTADHKNNASPSKFPGNDSNIPPTPTKSRLNFSQIKHLYPDKPAQITHSDNNSYESLLSPPNVSRYPNRSVDSVPYENGAADEYEFSIPLSLTAQELTLQESKTYMRWYSDILARTNSRTISISDVFSFLTNFKIPDSVRQQISQVFQKISRSVNIGEFFALLRVISHTLNGETPSRKLIKVVAPVPTPPSILSKKRLNEEEDSSDRSDGEGDNIQNTNPNSNGKPMTPLDIDGFTQFLLTGERPGSNSSTNSNTNSRKRKSKKVKFSDQIDVHDDSNYLSPMESPQPVSQNPLDYTLPMDQLLKQMQSSLQSQNPQEQEEEKEVLKDVEINNFQNLNSVDTVSVGGTPVPPSDFANPNDQDDNLLKPNMTGPAQMSKMFSTLQPNFSNNEPDLKPLRPNVTGPADMARLFSPPAAQSPQQSLSPPPIQSQQQQQQQDLPKISLSAFTSQMTGPTSQNTFQNTLQNGKPPVPRHRSHSSPIPNKPAPPPPPPRRRNASGRGVSSPQPQPQAQPLQQHYPQQIQQPPPALPPKIPNIYVSGHPNNDSTGNILDDLKAMQDEVDKIRNLTGGF